MVGKGEKTPGRRTEKRRRERCPNKMSGSGDPPNRGRGRSLGKRLDREAPFLSVDEQLVVQGVSQREKTGGSLCRTGTRADGRKSQAHKR